MPATPVPASTVILLRDGAVSPEVLMLERHAKSEFLPDMYVFPGGRVEERDHELGSRTSRLSAEAAARALPTVDAALALGFFVAAIRETFEESGILLARRRGSDELLGEAEAAALARHRLDVQSGDASFGELCESEDLDLAAELLAVHAHWITPEAVPQRFDTLFFSTIAPTGQRALHDGVESTHHLWTRPEDALEQGREGKIQIILPTALNLETLTGFRSASEALESSRARPVVPVLPVFEERDGKRVLAIPEEAGYPKSSDALRQSLPRRPRSG